MTPTLQNRCNDSCELCSQKADSFQVYTIPPKVDELPENQVVLCNTCFNQINSNNFTDTNHWRCLTGSIWSEVPSVQVLSYKILNKINAQSWAMDTLDTVYLDEQLIEWANAEEALEASKIIHKDSYGVVLETGDTVILTKNLNVKGANFIAPKGTIVRKIRLVPDNAEQIEGKIEGDTIVILTKYVRKSS
jgi:protein PhnA